MKKLMFTGSFGAMLFCAVLSGGCAADQTHTSTATQRNHTPTYAERLPYIDEKGHYQMDKALRDHPDWEVNWGG